MHSLIWLTWMSKARSSAQNLLFSQKSVRIVCMFVYIDACFNFVPGGLHAHLDGCAQSLMNVIGISVTNRSPTESIITSYHITSMIHKLTRLRSHAYLALLHKAMHEVAEVLCFSDCTKHCP